MPLRLRLALIYGFLAIVTLVLALLLGYGFYERAAYRNADGLLAVIVTQAQLELEQTGFGTGLKPPPLLPVTLRLYDEVGVLRSSAGENNVPEIDLRAFLGNQGVAAHAPWIRLLPRVSPTAQTFDGFGLVNVDGVRWRSLTLQVGTGFLQGVASLAPYDAVLKTVQRTFVLIGLAGALLLALLGYLLSKASLFPLEQLSHTALAIVRSPRLTGSLKLKAEDKELSRLADVLNIAFEKLSDERARLDLALSSAKMGWWEWDVANDKHYWSPEFERLLGVPGGFAGGLEAFLERVHPEDRERVRKLVYDTLDSKRPPRFTYRVLDENGRVRYLSSRAQVYQNPAGQIIRLVGIDSDVTEAHLAQQQLRESEENLRYTLELNPQIPWSADPQGNLLDFSERWPRLVGRSRDELLRDGWAQLSPPEDRVLVQAAWRRALVSGEPYDVEHRIKLADGSLRWVHSRAFPRCDEAGQIVRWYGTTEDIGERKEIEERLREREARLRLALQNSAITLAGMDRELRYTWIHNPHPDFKEQEVIGKRDDELLPEEVAKQFVVVKRRALETGSAQRTEISVPLSDGLHSYDFLVEPTRDASGNILGLTSASFDISERKRAEEALRVSEERLSLALDGGQIGTFDWDIQSNSIYWSPNIEAFMGMTSGEFEQTFEGFIKRVYPDDQARVQEQIAAALVTGDYQCEFRMMRKDGTVRWVMARGRVFFSEARQPKRMVGVDVDVTERKAMETALREADRRKDEFLAVLAHELRNPLAPIRTGLEVMKLSDDPGLQQEAKAIIERQTTQLVHLVDDLLDVSRFARGKVRLNKEPLTIHEVVDMAVESASPLLEDRSHVLKISLPAAPIQIEGDKTRLCQIILNLLTNAAKYTPPGGTITLSAEASGDECVVTVQDTGIGLPKTMLTKVFDMFTRVEREESYQQQGLGIGLSLVKQLALLHGGTVTAESPGEGQGSTFTLRLPIFQGSDVKASKDALKSQAATSRSRRVLLVDDYEANLKTLSKMLQLMGHEVETAENGEGALERLKTFKAELVFLDINMPGMDGYEVARHIRADKAQQGVKVIALTGYGQPEDVERATKAGFDAHLVKPVELERLNGILNM